MRRGLALLGKYFFYNAVYALFWLLPKRKTRWMLGAWMGQAFADNSKYLFLYLSQHCPHIEAIWISKNKALIAALNAQGYRALYAYSLRAWWAIARAKVVCVSNAKSDILTPAVTSRHYFVQLWHGIPLKKIVHDAKIGVQTVGHPVLRKCLNSVFPWRAEYHINLLPASSKLIAERFSSAFQLPAARCPVLGFTRNDGLFEPEVPTHYILYAPTFRGGLKQISAAINLQLLPSELELSRLLAFTALHDLHYVLRVHPLVKTLFVNRLKEEPSIVLSQESDAQRDLLNSKVLITDFSSIMFDYLLLDRPIILYVPDYEAYITESRELYEDLASMAPGPIVSTWNEVVAELEKVFAGVDSHAAARRALKSRYFEHDAGGSAQRVVKKICQDIGLNIEGV